MFGREGPAGPPGELNREEFTIAINGTARNVNSVGALSLSLSNPPELSDVENILNKLNELINALHR